MLKEIVTTLGGTAILVGAVGWLIRSIVLHLLSKDIETYKADLRREMLEHEIRFRRVDEKVADHLAELYERLFKLYQAVDSYVRELEWSHEPTKEEKLKLVDDANREFNGFLFPNRLYLPPRLFHRAREFGGKLTDIASGFRRGLRREEKGLPAEGDHWLAAMDSIEGEINPLFQEIVVAFQKRLGVEDEGELDPHLEAPPDQPEKDDTSGHGPSGVSHGEAE